MTVSPAARLKSVMTSVEPSKWKMNLSAPPPPVRTSSPPWPSSISLPRRASMTSAEAVPLRDSPLFVPLMVGMICSFQELLLGLFRPRHCGTMVGLDLLARRQLELQDFVRVGDAVRERLERRRRHRLLDRLAAESGTHAPARACAHRSRSNLSLRHHRTPVVPSSCLKVRRRASWIRARTNGVSSSLPSASASSTASLIALWTILASGFSAGELLLADTKTAETTTE